MDGPLVLRRVRPGTHSHQCILTSPKQTGPHGNRLCLNIAAVKPSQTKYCTVWFLISICNVHNHDCTSHDCVRMFNNVAKTDWQLNGQGYQMVNRTGTSRPATTRCMVGKDSAIPGSDSQHYGRIKPFPGQARMHARRHARTHVDRHART